MPFTIPSADEALAPLVQSQVFETDLSILVAALSGTGVVSGCAVTAQGSPDMTVAVAAGTILAAGVPVAVTAGNLTVGAADATNPRVDLISASAAGVKTITAGVAAAVASVKPADLPSGHIGLAFVYVAPTDTAINTNEITDKRAILKDAVMASAAYKRTAGNYTTTSTSFVDIDGTNTNFTITTGARRLLIGFTGTTLMSIAGAGLMFDVDIDGVRVGGTNGIWEHNINGNNVGVGWTYLTDALTAGSHTIKFQWRVDSATGTIYGNSTRPARFYVIEQPT